MKTYAPKYNAVVNLGSKQECQCRKSAVGQFFASWLGLQEEGLMKHYGFDGSDHYRYARIF